MTHCCVIGGAGFIGIHLVELLARSGRRLTVIGRNPQPSRKLPGNVRYEAGDYGNVFFLTQALDSVDEIVTLAYSTVPKTSFDDPVQDILTNLPASVTLFEAAVKAHVKKLVFVSSGGTVYGKTESLPIPEDHPTDPVSPYGITKLAIEKYATLYHQLADLPVVCVRPGNGYGEGQRPFAGQGFIATATASLIEGKDIILFGETGTIRDYIHVEDIARGILVALDRGVPGSCYNIGTGIGRSNRDVLNALLPFAQKKGIKPRIRVEPLRQFDVPANVLDCNKLRTETGWEPLIPFEEGIRRTWDWFCNKGH